MENTKKIIVKELPVETIEEKIGYYFENEDLLIQAFTRRNYAVDNGLESNETLEFLGDEVLDYYVSKELSDRFGSIKKVGKEELGQEVREEYVIEGMTEETLTEIKKDLVDNENLSMIIDEWGFANYLYLNENEINNNVQNELKVKADLFEAILGAIAIDCNWDPDSLQNSVSLMLGLDFYFSNGFILKENYVSLLQNWFQKKYNSVPEYEYEEIQEEENKGSYKASLAIKVSAKQKEFSAFGKIKKEARFACAKTIYNYLEENNLLVSMKDFCPSKEDLNSSNATDALEKVSQQGYFSKPKYEFINVGFDKDGNPKWECRCYIKNLEMDAYGTSTSKKEAKGLASYYCLCDILGYKPRF